MAYFEHVFQFGLIRLAVCVFCSSIAALPNITLAVYGVHPSILHKA